MQDFKENLAKSKEMYARLINLQYLVNIDCCASHCSDFTFTRRRISCLLKKKSKTRKKLCFNFYVNLKRDSEKRLYHFALFMSTNAQFAQNQIVIFLLLSLYHLPTLLLQVDATNIACNSENSIYL